MDRELLKEIIRDLENVSKVVSVRLDQLYSLLGDAPSSGAARRTQRSTESRDQVRESIEKQRQDMMNRVEEMRRQAMAQVQESINNSTRGAHSMPGIGGMPGATGFPGASGMAVPPMPAGDVEELRRQLEEKMKAEQPAEKTADSEVEEDDGN